MKNYKTESEFQADVIKDLHSRFPGCIVLKNDPTYIQGIPDLSIFFKTKWAMLECKISESAPYRPNQKTYLDKANQMSYSATIYPENKEEILNELQSALGA